MMGLNNFVIVINFLNICSILLANWYFTIETRVLIYVLSVVQVYCLIEFRAMLTLSGTACVFLL